MPRHVTSRPDAACAGLAPTARSPASTSVNELAYPTIALNSPATTGRTHPIRTPSIVPFTERWHDTHMGAHGASSHQRGSEVGRRLRGLREARGLTLSELARTAHVGKATLSGLENGTRDPRLETLYAIAAALDV